MRDLIDSKKKIEEFYSIDILNWADSMGIGAAEMELHIDEDGKGFIVYFDTSVEVTFTQKELDAEFGKLFSGIGFTYEIRCKGRENYTKFVPRVLIAKKYYRRLSPEELQKETESFINVMCNGEKEEEFVELMSRSHRTLQQNYTRFVLKWIKKEADSEYFDARNEASVMSCRKIVKALGDEFYLPTI